MMNPTCFKFLIQAIFVVCLLLQLQVDLVCVEGAAKCIEKERQALLHLKAALVDDSGMLSSWEDKRDCCQWTRVRCSNLTGHILSLDLHADRFYGDGYTDEEEILLSGKIPASLVKLQQLRYLNFTSNDFTGIHIPEFFGSLTNLRYLDLSSCNFVGKIPSQFGSLLHLKYLNLAGNVLEGSIPNQLGNLSKLQYLDLSYNSLEGAIPSRLGNLSSLQELYFANYGGALKIGDEDDARGQWLSNLNSLTHLDLSSVLNLNSSHNWLQMIGNLSKLRELRLSDCSLSDHFIFSLRPSEFNFSNSLSVLDLSWNTFTSPMIIQWVSNVTFNLVELDLYGNLLEGNTSSHFGTMMNYLEQLDLSGNNLKGEDLKFFMNICTLRSLYVVGNNLSGDLPSIIHNLSVGCARHSLRELELRDNQITGTLPDLSIFSSLKTLDLSENRLSGKMPEGSRLPSQLESLSIESNFLEGGIPKSFGNSCTLSSLFLFDNSLNEDILGIIERLSGCARYSLQELYLDTNQITGTLPDLSMFSTLRTLGLSENRLNGKIPEEGRLSSRLEHLSIGSNSLEGGIPKSFGNSCTLGALDMSNNSLSEEFRVIIHHLSGCARYSLKSLDLSMNQIKGTLPNLSQFSSLESLYLFDNKLNGNIPKDIQFPSQLRILDMSSSYLKGVITDFHFANMSKLKSLHFSDNPLALVFSQHWVPPFQLEYIGLRSCKVGPTFPKWLQRQNNLFYVDISNAEISDIVPKWFWAKLAFQMLATTNISYNKLKGTIPNLPLRNSDYFLSLASNQFEGSIPPFLRGAISLDLSKNKFSDSLSFVCANGSVETLGQLDLSNNQLSGQIPDCWSYFRSLAYLDLSHNNFSGKIPTSMGSLNELQALILRNNTLSEENPSSMKNCTNLVMLDVRENKLSGHIPSWIGSTLQKLQFLSLQRNHFFGSLPLELCYLTSIHLLDLSLNNLSGQIPKCIKNFTSMAQKTSSSKFSRHVYYIHASSLAVDMFPRYYELNAFLMWKGAEQMFKNDELYLLKSIDLSSNQLSEEIPSQIENLLGLVSLNLSRNNLTGEIPLKIGRLTSLETLDLSRNELFGSIPSSLTQIDWLTVLDLSHNHLSGRIPTSTQLQSFDASSYEDNLDLCGKPLEKLCSEGEPLQEPTAKFHDDEHLTFAHAFYMSMGFGFAVGFWGIFGSILVKRSWRHAYFRFLNNLTDNIHVMVAVTVAKYNRWLKA